MAAAQNAALASPALVEQVRAITVEAVAAWQARWGLARMDIDTTASPWEDAGRPRTDAAGEWHDGDSGTSASLFWPACTAQRIEHKLFARIEQEMRSGEGSLARETAQQVAGDLRSALLASWKVHKTGTGAPAPRWSRWLAPVQVRIDLGQGCCLVAVLAGAALCPRAPAPRGGLGRMDASGFHALPARAELLVGRADIPLPEIAALQVGDVIVLDSRIHDPLPLRLPGGAATLHANLGRAGDRRAAQLVSHTKTEGSI